MQKVDHGISHPADTPAKGSCDGICPGQDQASIRACHLVERVLPDPLGQVQDLADRAKEKLRRERFVIERGLDDCPFGHARALSAEPLSVHLAPALPAEEQPRNPGDEEKSRRGR